MNINEQVHIEKIIKMVLTTLQYDDGLGIIILTSLFVLKHKKYEEMSRGQIIYLNIGGTGRNVQQFLRKRGGKR